MSRRDSRVHISVRQNDALLEFENFKRKYLLVNKHITKLNSTLSVRVEELNAQVSTLYVENLRLRAVEISLSSQLKKEKDRTHRVMHEAESAVGTLMEHLAGMRASLDIQTPKDCSPPAKRRSSSSPVQPPREVVRLVRPPAQAITQIRESDEEDMDEDDTPTRTVTTRRPSTSRLPLPKLAIPQQPAPLRPSVIPHINLAAGATKRKTGRRNSALLVVERQSGLERAPSPVAGMNRRTRRSSVERDDEEREVELAIQVGAESGPVDVMAQEPKLEVEAEVDLADFGGIKPTEWSRSADHTGKVTQPIGECEREAETYSNSEKESSEGSKEKRRFGIKDVTNSPRKCPAEFVDEQSRDMSVTTPSSLLTTPSSTDSQFFDTLTPKPGTSPLLSAASTPATDGGSDAGESTTGRERRARRSVNYAEPKLNTKMRKPDPAPDSLRPRASAGGTATRRRRSINTSNTALVSDEDGDADVEGSGAGMRWLDARRKTVHNTVVNAPSLPPNLDSLGTGNDAYGQWGDETRRHSMAV